MSAETNTNAPITADPALPPTDPRPASDKNLPISPEMPGSEEKRHISLPSSGSGDIRKILSTTDATIDHLNKLLKTPGGLASFLSTFNYGLYILAHVHSTAPSRAQVLARLATFFGRPAPLVKSASATAGPSPLVPLALTIGDLRTTLRLTGLIPLYVLLKSLIKSNEPDKITYAIRLAQCLSYIGFQAIENVAHLTTKTVVSANWTNTKFARLGGVAKLSTWSCRSWLCGITCDFLRLFREAQLARSTGRYARLSEDEKREVDKKWWAELFVALSWYPMAVHYSVEGGIGLNLGMVGACGFLANLGNFLKAWHAIQ